MAVVSDVMILAHAMDAGWADAHDAQVATAIALAESGGNPSATNHNFNGSTDYGLWQINSIHKDVLANGQWSDPAANAKMAHEIYAQAGNRFTPWVTFTTGRYLAFMPRAAKALVDLKTNLKNRANDPKLTEPAIPNPLNGLQKAGAALSDPNFWRRITYAILGAILLVWSMMKMTGDNQLSETSKSLLKTGAKVAVA